MSVASNQYAAKVFSEHPIALWPLDDDISYISLISDEDRDITTWMATNCSVNSSPDMPIYPAPFVDEQSYFIVGDHTSITVDGTEIEIQLDDVFQFSDANQDLSNFCVNFYMYQYSAFVNYYEFGFRYYDNLTSSFKEVFETIEIENFFAWKQFSQTFNIEEFDSDTCTLFIRINVNAGGGEDDYNFIINGLSVGQWSEPYCSNSLGRYSESLPVSSGLVGTGVTADQYGPLSDNAFFVVEDGKLLAKNDGIPMVFGSENVTKITASESSSPSIIIPGQGFFSERGRNRTSSIEFWLKINPNTKVSKRIFGPLDSDYGLYVSEGLISLLVGDSFASHNVSEWYRPMLIHINYNEDNVSMLVNGEQVIEISYDRSTIQLPQENEWLGFYSYQDIDVFEIDCISIMPYPIPLPVAKRRFVWGQGVYSQEIVDAAFGGKTAAIGFANANYSSNIIYPDKERWDAGYYNNLSANTRSISMPNYSLPDIFLSGRSESVWYSANEKVNNIEYPSGTHPKFITFRPGLNDNETEWERFGPDWTEKCYLQFSSANISSAPFGAFYGIFEVEETLSYSRPLIHIVNSLNGKRFEINIYEQEVSYSYNGTQLYSFDATGQEHVVVGLHIPTVSQVFGNEIASFFSSYESLRIYVGGSPDTQNQIFETFEGKIYKVSFSDAGNFNSIESHFTSNGFTNYEDDSLFLGHYATYTLSPIEKYNRFFLDVSVRSTWEEYFPLSFFAQYVGDPDNNPVFTFDFLQFNVGYPSIINSSVVDGDIVFDMSESSVRMFATFQLIVEGADEPLSSFEYTKDLKNYFVVDASKENTSVDPYRAYKTKFEIVDGTVIYPPKTIRLEDVAIVITFDINCEGIRSNPITIRDLEITSKALNKYNENSIGTKFSRDIYPYTKSGIYLNYSDKNPVLIYKKNMPYLYLTEDSGIKILTKNNLEKEYGAIIPINETRQQNFYIGAIQTFIKTDPDLISQDDYVLFEFQHKNSTIEFYFEYDSSIKRKRILARDKWTKQPFTSVTFYQNGILVTSPYILNNEWNILGIVFDDPIDCSEFTGSINIFGGATYNNISFYKSEGLSEISSVVPRRWLEVLTSDGITNNDWQYWYDENGTGPIKKWKDVYVVLQENFYALTSENIFKAYTGTNIDVVDDDSGISLENDSFIILVDESWSSLTGKPV